MSEAMRYPIGRFQRPSVITVADRTALITRVAAVPAALRVAVAGLDDGQLDTPYREGGWTVRQVVHHLPDSHMNAYIRTKLGLTEASPTIKPYEEDRWAHLPDTAATPIANALTLLEALHERWVVLWRAMDDEDFARDVLHPQWGVMRLDVLLASYAWHGDHHLAHLTSLRERQGW